MEVQCGLSLPQVCLTLITSLSLITGHIGGLEHLWVIGDRFCFDTVSTHLVTLPEEESYIKRNFDVGIFASSFFTSNDSNVLSRIFNQLNRAMVINKNLPKLILVVLEDDVINALMHRHEKAKCSAEPKYKKEVSWLVRSFMRAIDIFKDFLPIRARKEAYPHVLWVVPTILTSTTITTRIGNVLEKNSKR